MRQRIRTACIAAATGAAIGSLASFAVLAGEAKVVQSGKAFEPVELKVKAGDSVLFANSDFYDHNVYSESEGNVFNLGIQAPGENSTVMLASAGAVEVRCRIHPKMKMTITVE